MRISSITNTIQSLVDRVQSKSDADGDSSKQQKQQQDDSQNQKEKKYTEAEVSEAMHIFSQDKILLEQGLKAELEGQGPGLMVALKDREGRLIRHITADEIMRMKESSQKSPRPIGKILDQKY